jgi:hypothetical protein
MQEMKQTLFGSIALLGLTACAEPMAPHRVGGDFVYPVSDSQALAECKADALRDFHNSYDHNIFDALDIWSPIRTCMAGKGYVAEGDWPRIQPVPVEVTAHYATPIK